MWWWWYVCREKCDSFPPKPQDLLASISPIYPILGAIGWSGIRFLP